MPTPETWWGPWPPPEWATLFVRKTTCLFCTSPATHAIYGKSGSGLVQSVQRCCDDELHMKLATQLCESTIGMSHAEDSSRPS